MPFKTVFRRYELKYMLTYEQKEKLRIRSYEMVENNGNTNSVKGLKG